MKKKLLGALLLLCSSMAWAGDLKLWYGKPAKDWTEALPVGNSKLGAMVYGGTGREELQLNEETFWAGGPYDNNNPNALYVLPVVRNLIFQGKTREAQRLVDANFFARKDGMSYLTMGSLFLVTWISGMLRPLPAIRWTAWLMPALCLPLSRIA